MSFKNDLTKTIEPLAAGVYWIGDPCYAFSNDHPTEAGLWMEWLESAWKDGDRNQMKIMDGRVRGRRIAAAGTKYGDGEYPSTLDDATFPVDAGLIGVIHESFLPFLMPTEHCAGKAPYGMTRHEFSKPFHVEYDDTSGDITIGDVTVCTGEWDVEI